LAHGVSGVLLSATDQAAMDHAGALDHGTNFHDDSGPQSAPPSTSDPALTGGMNRPTNTASQSGADPPDSVGIGALCNTPCL
jgi:hypothetical protein